MFRNFKEYNDSIESSCAFKPLISIKISIETLFRNEKSELYDPGAS